MLYQVLHFFKMYFVDLLGINVLQITGFPFESFLGKSPLIPATPNSCLEMHFTNALPLGCVCIKRGIYGIEENCCDFSCSPIFDCLDTFSSRKRKK